MESAVRRREPTIQKLAKAYNRLCSNLAVLIHEGKVPNAAVPPPQSIDMDQLFNLDVDDEIWQDIGLEEMDSTNPPHWMSEDAVRDGIKAMLELDRCKEEGERLVHECRALQI